MESRPGISPSRRAGFHVCPPGFKRCVASGVFQGGYEDSLEVVYLLYLKGAKMTIDLSKYHRVFVGPDKHGWYSAFIAEFPGCIAEGRSLKVTNQTLERKSKAWINAALSLGQTIPEPFTPGRLWRESDLCFNPQTS